MLTDELVPLHLKNKKHTQKNNNKKPEATAVAGILSSCSGKVHGFLALNKLSSLQLPTRKLNFQVLHKSLVITNIIIGAVTVCLREPGLGWEEDRI